MLDGLIDTVLNIVVFAYIGWLFWLWRRPDQSDD
jgi:hypothetical protein